ncbi:MAG: hypothetical protein ABIT16_06445 [Croceibacterium sp.]
MQPDEGLLKAAFLVLMVLQLVIVAGSMAFNGLDLFRNLPAARQWGFQTYTSTGADRSVYVGEVAPIAARAGIRANDRFVAINDHLIEPSATEFDIGSLLDSAKGSDLRIVTRSDAGTAAHVLTRLPNRWTLDHIRNGMPLWLFAWATYLNLQLIPLLLVAAALLLFLRRPNDREALLFATGFVLLANESNVDFWLLALFGVPTAMFGALVSLGQSIVVIAAAGFPGAKFDTRLSRFVAYAAAPAIFSLFLVKLLAPAATSFATTALSVVMLSAVVVIVLRYRSLDSGAKRQQIKWFVLGFAISAIASLSLDLLPEYSEPGLRGNAGYYVFYQLLRMIQYVALPFGLLISLLRYRLYDAERTISRSAAYAGLSVVMLAVFAGTERLIEVIGEEYFGGSGGAIAGAMSAAVVAVMIAPMHHRIDHWAKHYFQRSLVRLAEELPRLVGDLREIASPRQIATAAASRIEDALHTRRVAIVSGSETLADVVTNQWPGSGAAARVLIVDPQDSEFALRYPLGLQRDAPVAWLLIGPRPDGSSFGKDEREVLEKVADHLGRAMEIADQRSAAQASHASAIERLARRVQKLEKRVAATDRAETATATSSA